MYILVACEESQAVTIEMRKHGHIAFSCDIRPCSGGCPEWHIQQDVLKIINGAHFLTMDGVPHTVLNWDMIIAFPPCTDLAASGARWFEQKRADGRQQQGIDFFLEFVNCDCPKIAIENPVGIMSTVYRKPDQIIQPYEYGHMEQKATCLWLKSLPLLQPTNNVYNEMMQLPKKERERIHYMSPRKNRAIERSKTYIGIARAMAEQWAK